MKEASTVNSLEQIKVMAHPLRMQLLEAFSHKPMTTKQVAQLLAEQPTKLYHHVDALSRVGLIKLVRTRKKRGTVEKYYQTVARTFAVDRRLFRMKSQARAAQSGMLGVITTMLEDTLSEIHESLAERLTEPESKQNRVIVTRSRIRVTPTQMAALDEKIKALLQKFETRKRTPGMVDYGFTLAMYPVKKKDKEQRRNALKHKMKRRKK